MAFQAALGAESTKGLALKAAFTNVLDIQTSIEGGNALTMEKLDVCILHCLSLHSWVSSLRPGATVPFQHSALKVLASAADCVVHVLTNGTAPTTGEGQPDPLVADTESAMKLVVRLQTALEGFNIDISTVKLALSEQMAAYVEKNKTSALLQRATFFCITPSHDNLKPVFQALKETQNKLDESDTPLLNKLADTHSSVITLLKDHAVDVKPIGLIQDFLNLLAGEPLIAGKLGGNVTMTAYTKQLCTLADLHVGAESRMSLLAHAVENNDVAGIDCHLKKAMDAYESLQAYLSGLVKVSPSRDFEEGVLTELKELVKSRAAILKLPVQAAAESTAFRLLLEFKARVDALHHIAGGHVNGQVWSANHTAGKDTMAFCTEWVTGMEVERIEGGMTAMLEANAQTKPTRHS
jgi:hypothetical protein